MRKNMMPTPSMRPLSDSPEFQGGGPEVNFWVAVLVEPIPELEALRRFLEARAVGCLTALRREEKFVFEATTTYEYQGPIILFGYLHPLCLSLKSRNVPICQVSRSPLFHASHLRKRR